MQKIEISSKDNEKIKILRKLGSKKYRNKLNKFLVENLTIIHDALKKGSQPESIFLTQEFFESKSSKLIFILKNIDIKSVFIIDDKINKYFSSLKTPVGITAVYKKEKNIEINFKTPIIYLNGIKDPGNLGTILRSAVAFGIEDVVIDEECVDLYNSKVIQSAKDSIFKLNIIFDIERDVLEKIGKNMDILVTDVNEGEDVERVFSGSQKFCVVIGSESHGVSDDIKNLSNKIINIKSDSKMESLNVAVSTGIILYEIYNRK